MNVRLRIEVGDSCDGVTVDTPTPSNGHELIEAGAMAIAAVISSLDNVGQAAGADPKVWGQLAVNKAGTLLNEGMDLMEGQVDVRTQGERDGE